MARSGNMPAGVGLFTPMRKVRQMLAEQEQRRRDTIGGLDIGVDELIASTADPAEAAQWQDQFNSYKELMLSDNAEQQQAGYSGLSSMAQAVRDATDRRREAQQNFVIEQARDLRTRYQKALEPMRELQGNMEAFDALLSDPDFDQNMALNRGALFQLLESSTRQMLSDPADFSDAVLAAGGGGMIGSLIKLAGGTMKEEEFNFTKEDYARIARAMYTFNELQYERTAGPLEAEALALEQASTGLDFLPPGYSLSQYVTGSPEKFENPLAESYGSSAPAPPAAANSILERVIPPQLKDELTGPDSAGEAVSNVANAFMVESGLAPGDPEAAAGGPNFTRLPDDAMTPALRFVYGDLQAGINDAISPHVQQGAVIKVDPNTGALFAFYPDGRREPVETKAIQQSTIRDYLRRRGQPRAPATGVIRR